ncbi:alpha/beta hydrolase [Pelagibius sp.]|uniref:alpha/beta hydrolase n=1 Tax=Pelagibius sp. TaxID=1931238 RepID=UPI002613A5A9|nr:alpha/beta fold hydrolase [Pelagibius sp.]
MESILTAPGPEGLLEGTLLKPAEGASQVVLIIPGSGPTDRDGNSPYGVRAATYRLLAEGLAAAGVASLRIDKRGMFASQAALADPNAVTVADYANDIRAWATVLREETGIACTWLLGHSEGGLVALMAVEQNAGDFCGLILAATHGRPFAELLREQLMANPNNAAVLDEALQAVDQLQAGRRVNTRTMHPALLPLFHPSVQGYLMDLFAYDPAALLKQYGGPVLILQGARDIQVSEADARRLSASAPAATLRLLADTNHVLKEVRSPDRAANQAAYTNPDLPLAPGVLDSITDFLKTQSGNR